MNSDPKHLFRNLVFFFLFWGIAFLLAFFAIPRGGGGGIGNGPFHSTGSGGTKGFGSADKGKGPGAGEEGLGKGKAPHVVQMGDGSSDVKENKKETAEKSPKTPPAKKVQKGEGKSNAGNTRHVAIAPPPPPPPSTGTRFVIRKKKEQIRKDPAAAGNTATVVAGSTSGRKGFFGAEVSPAGKILFLIDTSGSMGTNVCGRKTDRQITRLETVKRELNKVIRSMGREEEADGRFLICRFSSNYEVFPSNGKPLRFSSYRDRKKALQYLQGLSHGGNTNMLTAWKGITQLIQSAEIDTVFFLSDGEPGDCNEQSLCQYLKQNLSSLKINTFFITEPGKVNAGQLRAGQKTGIPGADLMKSVAEQHKGVLRILY